MSQFLPEKAMRVPSRWALIFLLAALALLPWMITRQSLWLDEGDTAIYAIQPTLKAWTQHLATDRNADCQMPLTMFTVWADGQLFGTSEWALRSQNLGWGAIGLLTLYHTGKKTKLPALPLFLVIQPFFWFYMNEARPYIAQVAAGSLLQLSLVNGMELDWKNHRRWWIGFLAAILLAFSISMLSAVVVIFVVAALVWVNKSRFFQLIRKQWWTTALFAIPMLALSSYYIWTLTRGAAGSRIWAVDLKSVGFIFYELIGCLGLGPSLDTIRETASSGHLAILIPQLWAAGLLALLLVGIGCASLWKKRGNALFQMVAAIIAGTAICMVIASFLLHKPLWARHFSPVLPFIVLLETAAFHYVFSSPKNGLGRIAMISAVVLLAISAAQIRLAPRFIKDDYRTAAATAKAAIAEGKTVWWGAAEYTGLYYRVPLEFESNKGLIPVLHGASVEGILLGGSPDLIIMTRPEVYDPHQEFAHFIRTNHYLLLDSPKNFQFYTRPSTQP